MNEQQIDRSVEIQGETWICRLTPEEYAAWVKYDESHPWLAAALPMRAILDMFLSHYRRGVDLNKPLGGAQ